MSLTRSRAVLELGKRLVSQLNIADDLLGSWMAHFLAERIAQVEESPNQTDAAALDECAKAILDIWQYRRSLPSGLRPMEDLEPALRTLASMDVERTDYRYFPEALRRGATADASEDARKWLDLAIGLDYSARVLIQFALRAAAGSAAERAEPWVTLAFDAGADDSAERAVVRFILENDEVESLSRGDTLSQKRLSRLEDFLKVATDVANELRNQLSSGNVGES